MVGSGFESFGTQISSKPVVGSCEFRMKKYKAIPSLRKTANHSVRTLLHFIRHTVVTKREFVTPATLAVSVIYRKYFDNLHTMSMLMFMLVESRYFLYLIHSL